MAAAGGRSPPPPPPTIVVPRLSAGLDTRRNARATQRPTVTPLAPPPPPPPPPPPRVDRSGGGGSAAAAAAAAAVAAATTRGNGPSPAPPALLLSQRRRGGAGARVRRHRAPQWPRRLLHALGPSPRAPRRRFCRHPRQALRRRRGGSARRPPPPPEREPRGHPGRLPRPRRPQWLLHRRGRREHDGRPPRRLERRPAGAPVAHAWPRLGPPRLGRCGLGGEGDRVGRSDARRRVARRLPVSAEVGGVEGRGRARRCPAPTGADAPAVGRGGVGGGV
ncbi:hypothetical protein BU14_0170s0005 [Porphyra umbilicalis]|uniref:Uncharacterized protein n=1 Tax=Porphyra umbilicalis TaxID=2786 RepID=A0A1X6P7M0_PORUM|nr:hypothetical protein BU14_0170s0005 [Porphyra umbilicalis]OSX76890.1 hypothetical protein BU14_0170s0005 [Porphyra umbilicalis]|eukprot:OSX76889.1 hypothetical protein BU14_0170s0005 [Porphyra umbilicalis]